MQDRAKSSIYLHEMLPYSLLEMCIGNGMFWKAEYAGKFHFWSSAIMSNKACTIMFSTRAMGVAPAKLFGFNFDGI